MWWITRSEPGAGELASLLSQHACASWCEPVIDIVALDPWRCESLNRWPDPQSLVLVSRHATQYLLRSQQPAEIDLSSIQLLAVGPKTAQPLRDQGLQVLVPPQHNSEGLLALPYWRQLAAQHTVWILSGVGGRSWLEEQLSQFCRVSKLALYRRQPRVVPSIPVESIDGIVVASVDGLAAMADQWFAAAGRAEVELVVPSQRVAQRALELGFRHVHNAASAAPDQVWRAIEEVLSA